MTEKEKKLHKQIEEFSMEIIMLRNHIKETLKSQNRDCAKWFSIKDRLPETGINSVYGSDWVLAFDGENIYMSKYIQLETKQFWKEAYTDAPLSITHWTPLPSPPSSFNSDYAKCEHERGSMVTENGQEWFVCKHCNKKYERYF